MSHDMEIVGVYSSFNFSEIHARQLQEELICSIKLVTKVVEQVKGNQDGET